MNMRELASRILNVTYDFPVTEVEAEGVYVTYGSEGAVVGGTTKPALARAYMLLAKGISEGRTSFKISEKAYFEECGVMLDVSRGSVMKVSGVKEYLDYMALHGMNLFMLYTEDVYEVEGYPLMGYQRGRYTLEELREIDDYADSLGIEVIPCIQTLGHMGKFLRYRAHGHMAENTEVLLPGEEATYELIEACISTMRKAVRSGRIHIGCDETRGLGFGKYFQLHGYRDRFEIYNEHVAKVVDICRKYDFHPMMWSDMYFSMTAPVGAGDYNMDVQVPQHAIDSMPDADMVFWDYYHVNNEFYGVNIEKHQKFNRKIWFAGGIWSWIGHAPNIRYTYETVKPALEECLKLGVTSVFAANWAYGDTSHFLALPCLAMYSEYCYKGLDCTKEDIYDVAEFVTRQPYELTEAISDFHCGFANSRNYGLMLLWSDPLINLLCYDMDFVRAENYFSNALEVFEKYPDAPYTDYYKAIFKAALHKARVHQNLQVRYKAGDREWLASFVKETVPRMQRDFEEAYAQSDQLWHRYFKTQGFERLACHYGAAIERIRYTGRIVERYLAGEIQKIEALEPEVVQGVAQDVSVERVMYSC